MVFYLWSMNKNFNFIVPIMMSWHLKAAVVTAFKCLQKKKTNELSE